MADTRVRRAPRWFTNPCWKRIRARALTHGSPRLPRRPRLRPRRRPRPRARPRKRRGRTAAKRTSRSWRGSRAPSPFSPCRLGARQAWCPPRPPARRTRKMPAPGRVSPYTRRTRRARRNGRKARRRRSERLRKRWPLFLVCSSILSTSREYKRIVRSWDDFIFFFSFLILCVGLFLNWVIIDE